MFGPAEEGSTNAVEPCDDCQIQDAKHYHGHASATSHWHYHSPEAGWEVMPDENTMLGYAMDGFPIYGAVDDTSLLDECNGKFADDGSYRYHVRTKEQVDGEADFCSDFAHINWRYFVGCYHGDVSNSSLGSSDEMDLPSDCYEE